jgi:hypothetical protein
MCNILNAKTEIVCILNLILQGSTKDDTISEFSEMGKLLSKFRESIFSGKLEAALKWYTSIEEAFYSCQKETKLGISKFSKSSFEFYCFLKSNLTFEELKNFNILTPQYVLHCWKCEGKFMDNKVMKFSIPSEYQIVPKTVFAYRPSGYYGHLGNPIQFSINIFPSKSVWKKLKGIAGLLQRNPEFSIVFILKNGGRFQIVENGDLSAFGISSSIYIFCFEKRIQSPSLITHKVIGESEAQLILPSIIGEDAPVKDELTRWLRKSLPRNKKYSFIKKNEMQAEWKYEGSLQHVTNWKYKSFMSHFQHQLSKNPANVPHPCWVFDSFATFTSRTSVGIHILVNSLAAPKIRKNHNQCPNCKVLNCCSVIDTITKHNTILFFANGDTVPVRTYINQQATYFGLKSDILCCIEENDQIWKSTSGKGFVNFENSNKNSISTLSIKTIMLKFLPTELVSFEVFLKIKVGLIQVCGYKFLSQTLNLFLSSYGKQIILEDINPHQETSFAVKYVCDWGFSEQNINPPTILMLEIILKAVGKSTIVSEMFENLLRAMYRERSSTLLMHSLCPIRNNCSDKIQNQSIYRLGDYPTKILPLKIVNLESKRIYAFTISCESTAASNSEIVSILRFFEATMEACHFLHRKSQSDFIIDDYPLKIPIEKELFVFIGPTDKKFDLILNCNYRKAEIGVPVIVKNAKDYKSEFGSHFISSKYREIESITEQKHSKNSIRIFSAVWTEKVAAKKSYESLPHFTLIVNPDMPAVFYHISTQQLNEKNSLVNCIRYSWRLKKDSVCKKPHSIFSIPSADVILLRVDSPAQVKHKLICEWGNFRLKSMLVKKTCLSLIFF